MHDRFLFHACSYLDLKAEVQQISQQSLFMKMLEGEHDSCSHLLYLSDSAIYHHLKEKEKLYVELKQILARQPGPEAAEQLQQYKWTLRDKATKLKVILQNTRRAFQM